MDFAPSAKAQDFAQRLTAFMEEHVYPAEKVYHDQHVQHGDRWAVPPIIEELKEKARSAGIWNLFLPDERFGAGLCVLEYAPLAEITGRCQIAPEVFNCAAPDSGNMETLSLYGTPEQQAAWLPGLKTATQGFAFGITEPDHGSDATHMETVATRDGDDWIINGVKTWNTGVHTAHSDMVMARTSGSAGDALGITAFLVPMDSPGVEVEEYLWTFNMPSDHARVRFTNVRVPDAAIFAGAGRGLQVVQHFFNENRIRQAASSLGAAQYCVNEAVEYAKHRKPFGKALATNQAIQFPLVDLQSRCEMLRALIHKTAWLMDRDGAFSVSDKVSMCNYQANQLCCEAADTAMQVHGGLGYSRYKPFEHIYRHHRRYRITEGADEIQKRRIAGYMFGFMNQQKPKGVS